MNSKLTVFVCSTYNDLSEERKGVLDAIRRLRLEHDSMEFFGARANRPIETCLAEVRRSNILVVIVGHRYGSLVPQMEISYSEAEYREGYRLKKPCLVYVRGDDVRILPKQVERDPEKLRLLEAWKSTLQDRHTIATFKGKNDLSVQVAADLSRTIRDLDKAARARVKAHSDSPLKVSKDAQSAIILPETPKISFGDKQEAQITKELKEATVIIRWMGDSLIDDDSRRENVLIAYSNGEKVFEIKGQERELRFNTSIGQHSLKVELRYEEFSYDGEYQRGWWNCLHESDEVRVELIAGITQFECGIGPKLTSLRGAILYYFGAREHPLYLRRVQI